MADSPIWQLQDAKARFSELVQKTLDEGPQMISRRGKPSVVMVSDEEYARLTNKDGDFISFLRSAPRIDLVIERSKEGGRTVEL
ncbi:MAG: type II toxin-antitoxin system Phd/YefM family antitoxin [Rectinemataceae bacterium]